MDKGRELRSKIEKIKVAAQLLYQEAIDIESELAGLYPLAPIKSGVSTEELVNIQVAAYSRRKIPISKGT